MITWVDCVSDSGLVVGSIAQINECVARGVLHRNISDVSVTIAGMSGRDLAPKWANYKPEDMHARYIKVTLGEFK